jgi:hypothetical protein
LVVCLSGNNGCSSGSTKSNIYIINGSSRLCLKLIFTERLNLLCWAYWCICSIFLSFIILRSSQAIRSRYLHNLDCWVLSILGSLYLLRLFPLISIQTSVLSAQLSVLNLLNWNIWLLLKLRFAIWILISRWINHINGRRVHFI